MVLHTLLSFHAVPGRVIPLRTSYLHGRVGPGENSNSNSGYLYTAEPLEITAAGDELDMRRRGAS